MNRHLVAFVSTIVAAIVSASASTQAAGIEFRQYHQIDGQLQHSAVPVLLPLRLPREIGVIASVAVISADRAGYYVGFSTVAHCGGGLSCAFLHVAGYPPTTLAGRTFGDGRAIALPDSSQGYYAPRICSGSRCTQGSLMFKRHRNIYEIDADAGTNDLPTILLVYRSLRCVARCAQPSTVVERAANFPSSRRTSTRRRQRWFDR